MPVNSVSCTALTGFVRGGDFVICRCGENGGKAQLVPRESAKGLRCAAGNVLKCVCPMCRHPVGDALVK